MVRWVTARGKASDKRQDFLGARLTYPTKNPNQATTEWHFRHDKIIEFFIVQTFLGNGNDRPVQHLGDTRFRGVYFLLAMLMPVSEAQALRERLIHYAADTKDHTVSDTFVQLLRSRKPD